MKRDWMLARKATGTRVSHIYDAAASGWRGSLTLCELDLEAHPQSWARRSLPELYGPAIDIAPRDALCLRCAMRYALEASRDLELR